MNRRRIHFATLPVLVLCLAGCAWFRPEAPPVTPVEEPPAIVVEQPPPLRPPQEVKLARAIESLRRGNPAFATGLLEEVCAEPALSGVTDEALFRLALLTIDSEPTKEEIAETLLYLDRLRKEYPDSPWTAQAAPLGDLLTDLAQKLRKTEELRRQVKSVKELNLSLSRENKELRLNIERLKNLDLELERKK